jgi:hypothetical protein
VTRLFAFALLLASITPAAAAHWRPPAGTTFAIILSTAPNQVVTNAEAVDLDLFEAKRSTVLALKGNGKRVICYMSAGSWEDWRDDKDDFPPEVIGRPLDGWPGERYLDIRALGVIGPIMKARLELCKAKGFDAVDPDNVDAYEIGNRTGFPIRRADAIRYMRFLAREAHRLGLAIGLKNATSISRDVLDVMDFAVTEDCFDQGWCRDSRNFISANKPVFAIEYTDNRISFPAFCEQAGRLGLSPLLKRRSLDTWERRCPP